MTADSVRWEHIQRVFIQCNRNVSETARKLRMHRRTLQRILNKHAPNRLSSPLVRQKTLFSDLIPSVLFNTDYYSSNAAVAIWLDEPNTTSAVVYKIQGFCTYGTNTFYINRSNNDDDNVARVRSVSTITVMEVLA